MVNMDIATGSGFIPSTTQQDNNGTQRVRSTISTAIMNGGTNGKATDYIHHEGNADLENGLISDSEDNKNKINFPNMENISSDDDDDSVILLPSPPKIEPLVVTISDEESEPDTLVTDDLEILQLRRNVLEATLARENTRAGTEPVILQEDNYEDTFMEVSPYDGEQLCIDMPTDSPKLPEETPPLNISKEVEEPVVPPLNPVTAGSSSRSLRKTCAPPRPPAIRLTKDLRMSPPRVPPHVSPALTPPPAVAEPLPPVVQTKASAPAQTVRFVGEIGPISEYEKSRRRQLSRRRAGVSLRFEQSDHNTSEPPRLFGGTIDSSDHEFQQSYPRTVGSSRQCRGNENIAIKRDSQRSSHHRRVHPPRPNPRSRNSDSAEPPVSRNFVASRKRHISPAKSRSRSKTPPRHRRHSLSSGLNHSDNRSSGHPERPATYSYSYSRDNQERPGVLYTRSSYLNSKVAKANPAVEEFNISPNLQPVVVVPVFQSTMNSSRQNAMTLEYATSSSMLPNSSPKVVLVSPRPVTQSEDEDQLRAKLLIELSKTRLAAERESYNEGLENIVVKISQSPVEPTTSAARNVTASAYKWKRPNASPSRSATAPAISRLPINGFPRIQRTIYNQFALQNNSPKDLRQMRYTIPNVASPPTRSPNPIRPIIIDVRAETSSDECESDTFTSPHRTVRYARVDVTDPEKRPKTTRCHERENSHSKNRTLIRRSSRDSSAQQKEAETPSSKSHTNQRRYPNIPAAVQSNIDSFIVKARESAEAKLRTLASRKAHRRRPVEKKADESRHPVSPDKIAAEKVVSLVSTVNDADKQQPRVVEEVLASKNKVVEPEKPKAKIPTEDSNTAESHPLDEVVEKKQIELKQEPVDDSAVVEVDRVDDKSLEVSHEQMEKDPMGYKSLEVSNEQLENDPMGDKSLEVSNEQLKKDPMGDKSLDVSNAQMEKAPMCDKFLEVSTGDTEKDSMVVKSLEVSNECITNDPTTLGEGVDIQPVLKVEKGENSDEVLQIIKETESSECHEDIVESHCRVTETSLESVKEVQNQNDAVNEETVDRSTQLDVESHGIVQNIVTVGPGSDPLEHINISIGHDQSEIIESVVTDYPEKAEIRNDNFSESLADVEDDCSKTTLNTTETDQDCLKSKEIVDQSANEEDGCQEGPVVVNLNCTGSIRIVQNDSVKPDEVVENGVDLKKTTAVPVVNEYFHNLIFPAFQGTVQEKEQKELLLRERLLKAAIRRKVEQSELQINLKNAENQLVIKRSQCISKVDGLSQKLKTLSTVRLQQVKLAESRQYFLRKLTEIDKELTEKNAKSEKLETIVRARASSLLVDQADYVTLTEACIEYGGKLSGVRYLLPSSNLADYDRKYTAASTAMKKLKMSITLPENPKVPLPPSPIKPQLKLKDRALQPNQRLCLTGITRHPYVETVEEIDTELSSSEIESHSKPIHGFHDILKSLQVSPSKYFEPYVSPVTTETRRGLRRRDGDLVDGVVCGEQNFPKSKNINFQF